MSVTRRNIIGLLLTLLFAGCATPSATTPSCPQTTDLPSTYRCSGECVITTNGTRSVKQGISETDVISHYPGAGTEMYQVVIDGAGGFHELEIGPLSKNELRTATAEVSDGLYPVIEDYVFTADDQCRATGFTKLVRGLANGAFKACRISCTKSSGGRTLSLMGHARRERHVPTIIYPGDMLAASSSIATSR